LAEAAGHPIASVKTRVTELRQKNSSLDQKKIIFGYDVSSENLVLLSEEMIGNNYFWWFFDLTLIDSRLKGPRLQI
jgi:hypothetical protein